MMTQVSTLYMRVCSTQYYMYSNSCTTLWKSEYHMRCI